MVSMRIKGEITSWNDEKGYGFISPMAGGDRVFVHIKAFSNRSRRPVVGDVLTYSVSADARGRPCAVDVATAGSSRTARSSQSPDVLPYAIAAGILLAVGGAVLVSAIPVSILLFYIVVSFTTFAVYALDKSAAKKGAWRTA
jgi:cold shock CspA family protein